MSLFPL